MRSLVLSAPVWLALAGAAVAQQPGYAPAYPPPPTPYQPAPMAPNGMAPNGMAPPPSAMPQNGMAAPSGMPQQGGMSQGGMPPAGMPQQPMPGGGEQATGARPGNVIGTGMSLPMSNRASNINTQDQAPGRVAPNLPSPPLGENAPPADYLRAAQASLAAGRTGEAQQSLEMAQTRLLDRSVPYGQVNAPDRNPAVEQISRALQALAAGDRNTCMQLIEAAIPAAQASSR